MSSNVHPNRHRKRAEFLHYRTLLGMSQQEQADFCWADMKRFFKVTLWDSSHRCAWRKCPHPDNAIETFEEATLDHKLPRSAGGRTRLSNLQLMHSKCNSDRSSEPIYMSYRQRVRAMQPTDSVANSERLRIQRGK